MTDIADIDQPTTAEGPHAGVARSVSTAFPAEPLPAEPWSALPLTAVQLALHAGWTVAVLRGVIPAAAEQEGEQPAGEPPALAAVHELSDSARRAIEAGRLRRVLERLSELPSCSPLSAKAQVLNATEPNSEASLGTLHLGILEVLAAAGLELELAYQLGCSLHDLVDPRDDSQAGKSATDALAGQLGRADVAQLQEWLTTLSDGFPLQAAAIVSTSLGRWSDFAALTVGKSPATRRKMGDKAEFASQMSDCLSRQGQVWLMLLVGVRSTAGLLTPEGYVAAGEAALRRSARIIRGVLAHYWGALLFLAAALGGILYLAAANLGGASQVWTSIAAIGSTLGISTQSVKSVIARLSTEAERPVLAAAEEDVKAWAITTLPHADLTPRGVMSLRKSGVAKSVGLGRF